MLSNYHKFGHRIKIKRYPENTVCLKKMLLKEMCDFLTLKNFWVSLNPAFFITTFD